MGRVFCVFLFFFLFFSRPGALGVLLVADGSRRRFRRGVLQEKEGDREPVVLKLPDWTNFDGTRIQEKREMLSFFLFLFALPSFSLGRVVEEKRLRASS